MKSFSALRVEKGVVVSDLHLFAMRSRGETLFRSLAGRLKEADYLVLNGDIFDFRWSRIGNHEATSAAAAAWLNGVLNANPNCRVRYVLGNHDCVPEFERALDELSANNKRFRWHEYWMRLGNALFLHGDCAQGIFDPAALDRYREGWRGNRKRGGFSNPAYIFVDRLGLSLLVHRWHFPPAKSSARVAYYLDRALPEWRNEVTDCYFGHTHVPFSEYSVDGIRFHNTGSAIPTLGFNPLGFEVRAAQ